MIIENYKDPFVPEQIDDIPLTPFEYDTLCKGFEPDWEARYSILFVDGFHFVYRSGYWLKKIKYVLCPDGLFHIKEHYTTSKCKGENIFRDHVLSEGYFKPRLGAVVLRSLHKLPAIKYNPKQIGNDTIRYALVQESNRTLFVLGLNPSTADETKGDPTMKKVLGFARTNGHDGFVMLNVYPLRSTNPKNLPVEFDNELHHNNLQIIKELITTYECCEVLMAFGDNIKERAYLLKCLKDIIDIIPQGVTYYQIGNLTQQGFPRHPLYEPYQMFQSFEIDRFMEMHYKY